MTTRARGLAVLAVQLAVVLSIAGKYAWERHTCPMVWTRTAQFDPERVLRGRYLALTLHASACGLSQGENASDYGSNAAGEWAQFSAQRWPHVKVVARDGKLALQQVDELTPGETESITLRRGDDCENATLSESTEFFLSEHAKTPFPLAKGDELWALVTVPPSGPPRPVQLAVSDGKNFRVLDLR